MIRESVRRDWAVALTHRVPFLFDALAVFAATATYFYLGRFASAHDNGAAFFAFAVAGVSVLRLNSALPRILQNVTHGLADGTLERLLSRERSAAAVVLAEAAFELLRGLVLALASLVLAVVVFGAPMEWSAGGILGVAAGLLGAVTLFAGLMLCTVALLLVFRQAGGVATLTTMLVPVLSGAYFPAGSLPGAVGDAAAVLPFSATVSLVRDGMLDGRVDVTQAAETLVGVAVLLGLGTWWIDRSAERARQAGRLASW